ncbi:MAG: RcpC/CpaB family pilus assembly protein [Actinomycetota bacterium]
MIGDQFSEVTQEPARPRRRNPLTRVTASHLLMALAAVLAFATNLVVLRGHDQTRPVVVAAADVPAGRALRAADLRAVEVDVDDQLYATLVPWSQAVAIEGMVAVIAIPKGHLVTTNDFRSAAAPGGQRAMSIPIDPEHAVGGALTIGDRIDLIVVEDERPRYVVTGAEVLEVATSDGGSLASIGGFYLVVAVAPGSALDVAAAIRNGNIEIVRSTGSAPIAESSAGGGAGG